MFVIQEVSDLDLAFPTRGVELMPSWEDIPEKFKKHGFHNNTIWNQLFSDLFFHSVYDLKLNPKKGVDEKKAMRHLCVVMGCWGSKHEHKEAACAYMLSEWFKTASWKKVTEADIGL